MDRYARQKLLPQIGSLGQTRLANATVLLIGVGALGCSIADQLTRAGVGTLMLVDRDIVEWSNLQRQSLFDEADAKSHKPKALAASERLGKINSHIRIIHAIRDVTSDTLPILIDDHQPTVMIDGTDNVQTRYLINDASIANDIPWVYGAATGVEGRVMPIVPQHTPCLRCIFPNPPEPGELPTCDTVGVLNCASAVVASIQAAETLRLIVEGPTNIHPAMVSVDLWTRRFRTIDLTDARRPDCPSCAHKQFDYLHNTVPTTATLCGRNTVQVRLLRTPTGDVLDRLHKHLCGVTKDIQQTPYLLRATVDETIELSIFADGRVLVHGTNDPTVARSIVARFLG